MFLRSQRPLPLWEVIRADVSRTILLSGRGLQNVRCLSKNVQGTRAVSHSFLRSDNTGKEVDLCFTELVAQATQLGRNGMNGMQLQSLHFDLQATLSTANNKDQQSMTS